MSNREIYEAFADRLQTDWKSIARKEQLAPSGDWWNIWILLAGRGFGKSRSGAEWVRALAESGKVSQIALVGPTFADVRDTMISNGLLAIAPNSFRPTWEPSKRRLVWPNGVEAWTFSSEEPERLRGFNLNIAWCDELCAWKNATETWDMLQMCLRVGNPKQCITTTPKPIPLLRDLLKRDDVVITKGRTIDNLKNLAPAIMKTIVERYKGTRLGRQELDAEVLLDIENALWTRAMIDDARKDHYMPDLERVVVAVDPSGTAGAGDGGDSIGIVIAGKGSDGRAYVLGDWTLKASPDIWGRRAVEAYRYFNADRIVAERNYGGAMVEHVLRTIDRSVAYRAVSATRGKVQRAEPVSALYEQGRVTHVRHLELLESQMVAMTSQGYQGAGSPDRVDALVWALSDLMVRPASVGQFVFNTLAPQDEISVARRLLSTDHYHH